MFVIKAEKTLKLVAPSSFPNNCVDYLYLYTYLYAPPNGPFTQDAACGIVPIMRCLNLK